MVAETLELNKIPVYIYCRFSTMAQEDGDSIDRQKRLGLAFIVSKNEYELGGYIIDKGKSAYDGTNLTDGELGDFISKIKRNEIKKGSILCVENIDRISRQNLNAFLPTYLDIVNNSINLHVIDKCHTYSSSSSIADLLMVLLDQTRGNQESAAKSSRVLQAREAGRLAAKSSGKIITSRCPSWLHVVVGKDKNKSFELVRNDELGQDRVAIVQLIFQLYIDGYGMYTIAQQLNNVYKYKTFGKAPFFRQSFIQKTLKNIAVIGKYQPHTKTKAANIRTAIGEPIDNYYPAIITEEQFSLVQYKFSSKSHVGGRNGLITNLLKGICVCGVCKSKMETENKGYGTKLVCTQGKHKINSCTNNRINYSGCSGSNFEPFFLNNIKGLVASDLINDDGNKYQATKISLISMINSTKIQLEACKLKQEHTLGLITDPDNSGIVPLLREQLLKISLDESDMLSRIDDMQLQISELDKQTEEYIAQQIASLNGLVSNTDSSEKERIDLRVKMKDCISELIECVEFYNDSNSQSLLTNGYAIIRYKHIDEKSATQILSLETGEVLYDRNYHPVLLDTSKGLPLNERVMLELMGISNSYMQEMYDLESEYLESEYLESENNNDIPEEQS